MAKDKRPIIIIKKVKKGHGGHHGGSWKVAYADFVTAMMAFFMVMWILGMEEDVREAVEAYFSNPIGVAQGFSTGGGPIIGQTSAGAPQVRPVQLVTRQFEKQRYEELAERLQSSLSQNGELGGLASQVDIVVTEEGLRIELVEGGDGEMFFAVASAALKPAALRTLTLIGDELQGTGSRIVVEGHTDAAPFGAATGYTNFELSADRANAARRILDASRLEPDRIAEVRGHADRHLRHPDRPLDKGNRRISILLPYAAVPPTVTNAEVFPTEHPDEGDHGATE